MPELPEVETMVRDLSLLVAGRTITAVDVSFPGSIVWPDPAAFERRVVGQTITHLSRRGKYAIFMLASEDALIIHRGMSGSLLLRPAGAPIEAHVRVRFILDDGMELRFNDPRKFGKVYVMERSGKERQLPWARMGPEPLDGDFTVQVLQQSLQRRTALLKPLLLNQQLVAGLGNIYVDEALYRAGLHPERRANTLTPPEVARLHEAIRTVLGEAVAARGTTFRSYTDIEGRAGGYQGSLQVFHRAGADCPRCGDTIVRMVVGGRGSHICPTCQKV